MIIRFPAREEQPFVPDIPIDDDDFVLVWPIKPIPPPYPDQAPQPDIP